MQTEGSQRRPRRTLGSKEFQARTAATGNARSPRVDRRMDGTTSVDVLADLSRRPASTSVDIGGVSQIRSGAGLICFQRSVTYVLV